MSDGTTYDLCLHGLRSPYKYRQVIANSPAEACAAINAVLTEAQRANVLSIEVRLAHTITADCWCEPEVDYVDPDTGATVYVHRRIT